MGQERRAEGTPAPWGVVLERLRDSGHSPVVKMIDGLPAFPDEVPDEACRELRLGFAAGMVTLRRSPTGVSAVVWGTATEELVAVRDVCAESAVN